MSYSENKIFEKKQTRDISDQFSQAAMDSLLYGNSMKDEVPFQDYFKGMYIAEGNSYFHSHVFRLC